MQVYSRAVGPIRANCYIVVNDYHEALVIDPGADGFQIIQTIEGLGCQPLAILITHGHADHIGAVDPVRQHFGIPAYIHALEADFFTQPALNFSANLAHPVQLDPADRLWQTQTRQGERIGHFDFEVRFVPGHSPGHVSYYFPQAGVMVSGDTLFKGTIGRTDLPGGDFDQLVVGIRDHILSLPGETRVYPGHGQDTTVAEEVRTNSFFV